VKVPSFCTIFTSDLQQTLNNQATIVKFGSDTYTAINCDVVKVLSYKSRWNRKSQILISMPTYFSCVVQDILNNSCQDWWQVKYPLHGLYDHQTWIVWIFTCEDIRNPLGTQLLLTTKRHFTIALWMPVTLSATTAASSNGCGSPWWDVSRRALLSRGGNFEHLL
jgi:hypothetical protein